MNGRILIIVLLGVSCMLGQTSGYRVEIIGTDQGLSSGEIYSILQDKTGYLWIGTTDGLNRYDGYTFKTFRPIPFDTTSVSEGFFRSLTEDEDGNIWGATAEDGINKIDPHTNAVVRYIHSDNANSLPTNITKKVYAGKNHQLWVLGSLPGIYYCDTRTMKFNVLGTFVSSSARIESPVITTVTGDSLGNIWCSTNTNELIYYHSVTHHSEFYQLPPAHKNETIQSIFCESLHSLWIGTMQGSILQLNRITKKYFEIKLPVRSLGDKGAVLSFEKDINHHIWICTSTGVYRFHTGKNQLVEIPVRNGIGRTINKKFGHVVFVDRSNIVWIGTNIYGLIKVVPQFEDIVNLSTSSPKDIALPDNYIRGIYASTNGVAWIGTRKGLVRFDERNRTTTPLQNLVSSYNPKLHDIVYAVRGDRKGNIWVGAGSEGLYRYSPKSKTLRRILQNHSPNKTQIDAYVYDIQIDRYDRVWISTDGGGVIQLDLSGNVVNRFDTASHRLPVNIVRTTQVENDSLLWVGMFGHEAGLCELNLKSKKFDVYRMNPDDPGSLSNDLVLSLLKDSKGRLWVGTRMGLNLFHDSSKTFTHYTIADGLPNDIICNLQEDKKGNIWISTYYGISKFDGKNFYNYFDADGFQNDNFNTGASFCSETGRMYFGGVNGISIFDPEKIEVAHYVSPIVIRAVKQNGKSDEVLTASKTEEHMTLLPEEQSVTFEFAALDFRLPEGNSYAFLMEGVEKNWSFIGKQRTVRYTNLNGGTYRFRVKAAGRDGVWHESDASINVTVIPPIARRWWFAPLIVAVALSILLGIYILRVQQRFALEKIRVSIAADLHDEIGSSLARIANLADILVFTQSEKKSLKGKKKTPASDIPSAAHPQKIANLSRELLEKMSDVVWSVNPKNDDLMKLIDRIQTYCTEIADSHSLRLHFIVEKKHHHNKIDPQTSRAVLLIVKEALANILKHAKATEIQFSVALNERSLQITIGDNGKGFNESELPRVNGLFNMRNRANVCGGDFSLKSEHGKGTLIHLSLPV
jgi:ligand-binding sensor domain-containing protein/signal transduction histidine kinase